jgi:uncharacterized membrane protein HdeD (DUF308 family)
MANSDGLMGKLGADARALCKRTWWVFLVSGIASVIFGVLAISKPVAAWLVVSLFFAAAILVEGAFNLVGAIQNRQKDGWWIMLLIGILGLLVGAFALLSPPAAMMAFLYLVAFQVIMLGVFTIMLGYRVRATTDREWILYLMGALSVLFGIMIIAKPALGGASVIAMIASWALIVGALKIIFAFRIKSLPDRVAGQALKMG